MLHIKLECLIVTFLQKIIMNKLRIKLIEKM